MKLISLLLLIINFLNADMKECFTVEDKTKFISCLEKEVKKSDSIKDINFLASIYVNEKQYEKAIELYKKSIKKGDVKAMYYIGGIYNEALKDYDKALHWFEKSYEYDYKESGEHIGEVLDKKFNNNQKLVRKYLQNRIKYKEKRAYEFLGIYELRKNNFNKSIEAFKEAVNLYNSSKAMFGIGSVYRGYLKDDKKAIKWFRKAAKLKHAKAIYSIGYILLKDKKYMEAIKWFEKSEKLNHKLSSYAIADCYVKMKDYEKAKEQYLKMVKKGNIKAYKEIGAMYSNSLNNKKEAIKWYKKGIEAGDAIAAAAAGSVHKKRKDYVNAIKYYLIADKMGSSEGANGMAYYYLRTKKNNEKAIEWYKKANRLGDARGLKFLKNIGVYDG